MDKKTTNKILRAASKKLPIVRDRMLNERLSWCADNMADAYRIGAEEAQGEIIGRLRSALAPQQKEGE